MMKDKLFDVFNRVVIGMMGASFALVIQLAFGSEIAPVAIGGLVLGAVVALGTYLWEIPFLNFWWSTIAYLLYALVAFALFDIYFVTFAYDGQHSVMGVLTVLAFQMLVFVAVIAYSLFLEKRRIAEINAYLQTNLAE